jgi:class 3 adenylate cyclase
MRRISLAPQRREQERPARPVGLEGYRQVYALYIFGDLRGFTKWVKQSENELKRLLEILYTNAQTAFGMKEERTYLRRIVKFLGDGFFAVNEYDDAKGKPAVSDAFLRTFDDILSFRNSFRVEIRNANFHLRPKPFCGFGISYGPAVRFSLPGYPLDYAGGQVNLASRLCSKSEADDIMMELDIKNKYMEQVDQKYRFSTPPSIQTVIPKGLPKMTVSRIRLLGINKRKTLADI